MSKIQKIFLLCCVFLTAPSFAGELKIKILQNAKSGFRTSDEIVFTEDGIKVNSIKLKAVERQKVIQYKSFFAEFNAPNTGPCEAGYYLFARNNQKPSTVIISCNKGQKFAELMSQVHKIKAEGK